MLVDRHRYDVETGRLASVRFYSFTELHSLLRDAGFAAVEVVGHDGKPLTTETRRMVGVATR